MPYIKPDQRARVDTYGPATPGELNYAITRLISRYMPQMRQHLSYEALNEVLGALEGAKLEFVRRVVVPYEDRKRAENGDVYNPVCVEKEA